MAKPERHTWHHGQVHRLPEWGALPPHRHYRQHPFTTRPCVPSLGRASILRRFDAWRVGGLLQPWCLTGDGVAHTDTQAGTHGQGRTHSPEATYDPQEPTSEARDVRGTRSAPVGRQAAAAEEARHLCGGLACTSSSRAEVPQTSRRGCAVPGRYATVGQGHLGRVNAVGTCGGGREFDVRLSPFLLAGALLL